MPINIRAYEELLYMHYQITTDNYEPNESPLALENLIRCNFFFYTTVVYLYPNQTHSYFWISDLSLSVSDN